MTHRFPIKEIARQSGLGTATVDRALNNRAHVSPQTRRRVQAAISELESQEAQLAARGRRLFIDFVVEAPARFSREVRSAAESLLPEIGAAVCRPRFEMQETMPEPEILSALGRIVKRGSQGVVLKARDGPAVRQAIATMTRAGIPVVTLVTDIPDSTRLAYVGLDNASAGRTAAFLLTRSRPVVGGTVLTTQSHGAFLGEETRSRAFAETLSNTRPDLRIVDLRGGSGLAHRTAMEVTQALHRLNGLVAVYSMGGGNRSILETLDANSQRPGIYIAHDMDRENTSLLQQERLDFVLHHDLRGDIRKAFQTVLGYHRLSPTAQGAMMSSIQIVTPANIPGSDPT